MTAMDAENPKEASAKAALVADSGEKRLQELGYAQELERSMNYFEILNCSYNSATAFVAIVPYFGLTFINGGPVACVWFWWIVAPFAFALFASLAEIVSSLPTAGSLYFWAAYMAKPKWRPFAAFFTGWLEFVGLAFSACGVALAASQLIQVVVYAWRGGFLLTNEHLLAITVGELFLGCLLLLLPIKIVGQVFAASGVFQMLLAFVILITLPVVAPSTKPASFVFGTYGPYLEISGVPNGAYAFVLSLLMAQYNLYSFDGAAHVSEEAHQSDRSAPFAILGSFGITSFVAWALLVCICFCIQGDPVDLFSVDTASGGLNPVFQIMWDCFNGRFGNGVGAQIFFLLMWVAFFFNATAIIMASSRTAFALARDNGIPLAPLFSRVTSWKVPAAATILSTTIAALSGLFLLISTTAFFALAGSSSVAWFLAYAIPIVLRLLMDEAEFQPGPFYLAKFLGVAGGRAVHMVAVLYCSYTIAIFLIPTAFPITLTSFNWAPLGSAIILLTGVLWWLLNARFWFKGPHVHE